MTTKGTTRGLKAFHWQVGLVYLLSQGFYLLTLAPTVLWGDDAKFQWMAYVGELRPNVYDHPLWVAIAHLFTRIPLGDIAFRVNLSASVWAAITVALVFAVLVRTTGSLWAGVTGAGALMVSHTFWSHAVRAEVYTLNTALLMISLYALLYPALNWQALLLAGIAAGLAINNHVMMWLAIPGLLVLAAWRGFREKTPWPTFLLAAIGFGASIGLYRFLLPFSDATSLNPTSYIPTLASLPRQLASLAAYLVLQFPGPALFLAAVGAWRAFKRPWLGVGLGLIFLANVVVVLNHQVPDQYVFYIPTYVIGALWVGLGTETAADWLCRRGAFTRQRVLFGLLLLVLVLPMLVYALSPRMLPALGITGRTLGMREIPGRPALQFFLWPSKRGYFGARQFAEAALHNLPPNAVIIADYTVAEPMLYLQIAEHLRSDVTVAALAMDEQLPFALVQSRHTQVFLALTETYYDIQGLREHFDIVQQGTVYRLEPIDAE